MLYEVTGDLLADGAYNIICHQTNCMGIMGAGLAKKIADKYPVVQSRNKDWCRKNVLGTILPVWLENDKYCVNIYGQYSYGRKGRYTDYEALRAALNNFAKRVNSMPADYKIAFPHKIGCGLAGGDWNVVRPMLVAFANKVKQDVYIVKYPTWWADT